MPEKKIRAYIVSGRIIVYDINSAMELYKSGFCGKYVGVNKPKTPEVERPLELSFLEAVYLAEKGLLEVYRSEGEKCSLEELKEYARKNYELFDDVYEVYKDLRDKGYIVRPGLKYGSTFSVYRYGPGIDHAPFLVHVMSYKDKLDPLEIIRAGRLSHSVRKKFILATVHPETRTVKYYVFTWFRA